MSDLAEQYRRHGTHEWGQRASMYEHHRYSEQVEPRSRRRCRCCRGRATHRGMANGLCLMMGCELMVAQWVRDGTLRKAPAA
jgi:hypothetical protein